MIIKNLPSSPASDLAYLNVFPDQFKKEKEKLEDKVFVKHTMDYFANIAYAQYRKNKEGFAKNYDLMKGIISWDDFYAKQDQQVQSFMETIAGDTNKLPSYVKHYPILNPPINTMIGELNKRPDNPRVKAFDDDSKNEELEAKTNMLLEFVMQQGRAAIAQKMAMQGEDMSSLNDEDLESMTLEKVSEDLTDYTSMAERWANRMLTSLKVEFNLKEKMEEAFRDLLITAREFLHIYEDNSKTGFGIEVANPKNVWYLTTPNKKYSKDWYAGGLVDVMEISEIIEKFPELTKEEIDELRTNTEEWGNLESRPTIGSERSGTSTIEYDTYNRLAMQEKAMIESEMNEKQDRGDISDWLGMTDRATSSFGYKFPVVRAYFMSKKLVGEVNYIDEEGEQQTMLVDETYIEGSHPGEIEVNWGWVNQRYYGIKIGTHIYHMRPFKLMESNPIIGMIHEGKNTEAKSLVDLMKTYQALFNVCMNQLWSLLQKEKGNVARVSLRRIPIAKDGDGQDSIELWEQEAMERGVLWDDDSPENLKGGASSNTNIAGNVDLTRSSEMQTRYQLATQLKTECWELVGMNRQRLGGAQATETATANNNALVQSFAQTEPYFAAHEYLTCEVYQGLLDAAQYIESQKPQSTISYISNEGESAFIQINGSELSLRDLKVFVTSRPEDQQLFSEIRTLSQAMLQNGASPYEVIQLYSTNSVRQMKKIFKDLKKQQDDFAAKQQEIEQQQVQQDQQQFQTQLAEQARQKEIDTINENYNKEQDRINKKEVALIGAYARNDNAMVDSNGDGEADALALANMSNEVKISQQEFQLKMQEIAHARKANDDKRNIEMEKLKVERENMKNDKEIAQINAKARASKAKATTKKKK